MQTVINILISVWEPLVEIAVLWFVIYNILLFFTGTRAFQVVRGIIILILAFLISQVLGLDTLEWILKKIFGLSIIAILIIFQPEIRRGLARLGQRQLFSVALREKELIEILEKIVDSIDALSKKHIGSIIAIEREAKLSSYIESGISLDCVVSSELLQTIFMPGTILHDGAVIVEGSRIIAAGCLLPLTERTDLLANFGTRHRAAIGLSEETDALIIVTSEETGNISLAMNGHLISSLTKDELFKKLKTHISRVHKIGGKVEV
jgi:diadenylate cyclase